MSFFMGCGDTTAPPPDASSPCSLAPLGDPSSDISMEVVALQPDGHSSPLAEGAELPLIEPPQGGMVAFVGVRATNLDPCAVRLAASLRDGPGGPVRLDTRIVNLSATGDGWGASDDADIASFSNVPLCPNQWSSRDVPGEPYTLEVTLDERTGRRASAAFTVVPQCAQPAIAASCACICSEAYVLGQSCPAASP